MPLTSRVHEAVHMNWQGLQHWRREKSIEAPLRLHSKPPAPAAPVRHNSPLGRTAHGLRGRQMEAGAAHPSSPRRGGVLTSNWRPTDEAKGGARGWPAPWIWISNARFLPLKYVSPGVTVRKCTTPLKHSFSKGMSSPEKRKMNGPWSQANSAHGTWTNRPQRTRRSGARPKRRDRPRG